MLLSPPASAASRAARTRTAATPSCARALATAVGRMYQRIGLSELGSYLDLPANEAGAFAAAAGWVIEDELTAVAPLIADNQPRPAAAFDEGLKYGEVSNLVATLTR